MNLNYVFSEKKARTDYYEELKIKESKGDK